VEIGGLTLGSIADVGGWGVAFLVLLGVSRMMFTGKLVSQSAHERELNAALKDRDDWRETARAKDATIQVLSQTQEGMRDSMQVVEQFVRALPQPRQPPRGGR
jgi:hypothetical protein